jgi:hypothetical protein
VGTRHRCPTPCCCCTSISPLLLHCIAAAECNDPTIAVAAIFATQEFNSKSVESKQASKASKKMERRRRRRRRRKRGFGV